MNNPDIGAIVHELGGVVGAARWSCEEITDPRLPGCSVQYKADHAGWSLMVLATGDVLDGVAVCSARGLVVRLTPELTQRAIISARGASA